MTVPCLFKGSIELNRRGDMKARCADCKKWDYTQNNFGFCRASAPVPTIVEGGTATYALVWPSTGMDDWCMQFEASAPEETVQ